MRAGQITQRRRQRGGVLNFIHDGLRLREDDDRAFGVARLRECAGEIGEHADLARGAVNFIHQRQNRIGGRFRFFGRVLAFNALGGFAFRGFGCFAFGGFSWFLRLGFGRCLRLGGNGWFGLWRGGLLFNGRSRFRF